MLQQNFATKVSLTFGEIPDTLSEIKSEVSSFSNFEQSSLALITLGLKQLVTLSVFEAFFDDRIKEINLKVLIRDLFTKNPNDLVETTVAIEQKRYLERKQRTPFIDKLKEQGVNIDVNQSFNPKQYNFSFEEQFYTKIIEKVREEITFLPILVEIYNEHPVIFNFIRDIRNTLVSTSENKGDILFQITKEFIGNTNYRLPLDKMEILYFVTFLSDEIRYVVQEPLAYKLYESYIRYQEADVGQNQDCKTIYRALKEFFETSFFSMKKWSFILDKYPLNTEKENFSTTWQNGELNCLEKIISSQSKEILNEILDRFCRWYETVFNSIEEIHKKDNYFFQNIDYGHCFASNTIPLFYIFRDIIDQSFSKITPEKSGEYAVILEDDENQRKRYETIISKFTRFNIKKEGGSFEVTSDSLYEQAKKEEVKLFLLDIENNEDLNAGINTAQNIIKSRVDYVKANNLFPPEREFTMKQESVKIPQEALENLRAFVRGEPLPHKIEEKKDIKNESPNYSCKIILWSSSNEALNRAREVFSIKKLSNAYEDVSERITDQPDRYYKKISIERGLISLIIISKTQNPTHII